MELIFATYNKHKFQEAKGIIGNSCYLITPSDLGINEDIPENEETLEGNALYKANFIWQISGKNCFADDTGLEVESLSGAPGVKSARYAGEDCDSRNNILKLLKELNGVKNRNARFRTSVALIMNGKEYLFEGVLSGKIIETPSGSGGFGYDPVFIPDGYTKTLAELSFEEKNLISHRGIALRNLSDFIRNLSVE
ncbi:MAG: RdgB/HAM1 family non-canonical purine NTP pyrophosphatase [Bacteroidales bacterium]